MLVRFGNDAAARKVMNRIIPGGLAADTKLVVTEEETGRASPLALLSNGRISQSIPLWVIFFMSLLVIYFLMSWLPLIIKERGLPLDLAITAAVVLNIGGALGGVIIGRAIDRAHPYWVLAISFLVGSAAILGLGMTDANATYILGIAFVAGFCTIGTQTGLSAFTTGLYPTALRSTGLGTALAVGRIGSIIGPLAGGVLLKSGLPMGQVFIIVAAPPFVAVLSLLILMMVTKESGLQPPKLA
jgi:AAHS family 4-hydroxybenzoate transporter-like MFS transporter